MNKGILTLSAIFMLFSNLALAEVMVKDPYVRATPPGAKNSAAFMHLMNHSAKAIRLVGAKSDIAEKVEVHNHVMADGMMKMRQVEFIEIEGMKTVDLKPGGFHVMFIGLKQALTEGQKVEIKLLLSDGEEVVISAPVRSVKKQHKHNKHHH